MMNFKYSATVIPLLFVTAGILADESCQNNGTPLTGTHQKCDCPTGFKGFDCSEKVGPCDVNPCRNSAVCVDNKDGTFTCKCLVNYEGVLCEKKVRPCDRTPCKNGGKCSDDGGKCFKCECPDGYKGFDCSKKVLPCEVSLCQNGGVCSNEVDGGFKCTCTAKYVGLFCTKKAALFDSRVLGGRVDWIKQLEEWLPTDKQDESMKLCYRTSDSGWASSTFHTKCDNKGPTVVLVKVAAFYVFGAYASQPWGGSSRYIKADDSFLFSFKNKDGIAPFKSVVYQNPANAMYTNNGYGPTFGAHDLYIANNAGASTASFTNFGYSFKPPTGYTYNTAQVKDLLAGSYKFTPDEVEVYYFTGDE